MAFLTSHLAAAWPVLMKIGIAYLLTVPLGWEQEHEAHAVGLRTFPIVAIASCGYVLLVSASDPTSQSRVLQGLIAGIGFVGGGAILKGTSTVRGTATAASVWSTGVIGAAVAMGNYEVAVVLSMFTFFTLRNLWRYKMKIDRESPDAEPPEPPAERRDEHGE